jgi:septal ring factor EnvC (AmiA/AmiB activator)
MPQFRTLLTCILLLAAAVAAASDADRDDQLRRLEGAISRLQQEQQSAYQQFGMVQELRRSLIQQTTPLPLPAVSGIDGDVPDYDEQVRQRKQLEEQLRRYSVELDRLYARYRELEEQKRPLLDRISELSQSR